MQSQKELQKQLAETGKDLDQKLLAERDKNKKLKDVFAGMVEVLGNGRFFVFVFGLFLSAPAVQAIYDPTGVISTGEASNGLKKEKRRVGRRKEEKIISPTRDLGASAWFCREFFAQNHRIHRFVVFWVLCRIRRPACLW